MEEEYIRSTVYGVGASGTFYIRKKEHSAAPRPEKSGEKNIEQKPYLHFSLFCIKLATRGACAADVGQDN